MEEIPATAAPAVEAPAVSTENVNTNPASEVVAQAPSAPTANIPAEQIEEFNRFVSANGGYDKVFNRMKTAVSNPLPQQQVQQTQPVQQEQPQQAPQYRTPEGYLTQNEIATQRYFYDLANEEQFAPIADKIKNGEVFNEMAKFGIRPMNEYGDINNGQVREFLGLLAKTVPAKATNLEGSNAPTVDYISTEGGITSKDQALNIIAQSQSLRAQGMANHPAYNDALNYLASEWGGTVKDVPSPKSN